mmetsp:Transcript_35241/g.82184  ORF Transcript_35241/g.82184 Transcript_35241/m.82184 type:complete len:210 (-) Transcript_35241:75-704(-)
MARTVLTVTCVTRMSSRIGKRGRLRKRSLLQRRRMQIGALDLRNAADQMRLMSRRMATTATGHTMSVLTVHHPQIRTTTRLLPTATLHQSHPMVIPCSHLTPTTHPHRPMAIHHQGHTAILHRPMAQPIPIHQHPHRAAPMNPLLALLPETGRIVADVTTTAGQAAGAATVVTTVAAQLQVPKEDGIDGNQFLLRHQDERHLRKGPRRC